MRIALERPDQPEVVRLIAELDAYQGVLYPPESNHGIDIAALGELNVLFAVARDAGGEAIACGAVVMEPAFGELKRMYVRPRLRGRGIARALLAFLEMEAVDKGCRLLVLETGVRQAEALGFYASSGYARRGPFANYADAPLSVFMQKHFQAQGGG